MADNLVPITIDGHKLEVPRGTLVVEAARQIGIEIPVYCYHPKLKPVGACRVCMVEIEGQRAPVMAACTTEAMPNMVVHTRSDNAIAAREGILEFLLINHPLDCPVCDRGGECDLQDFTLRYGPSTTRFVEAKRHFAKSLQVGRNVILDRERCIMCQRCVRFCSEIAMEEGLVIVDRGNRSEIGTFQGRSFDSQYSGNTIELCPVGALTAKSYRFNARPWEQQHYAGVCNHCSTGCNITIDVRFDEVVRFRSRCNDEIDDGWLCDTGRYGHDHIHADQRIHHPLIRNASGTLEPASWEKALSLAAEKLKADGSKAAVLVGSQLSLEDGHALVRLARGVLKTSDIAHESAHEGLKSDSPDEHATGRVMGCDDAEIIICLGCDPHSSHANVDLRIKKGMRRGARLISLNSQPVMHGLADFEAQGAPSELWQRLLRDLDAQPEVQGGGLKLPRPRPWEAGGATSTDWNELVCALHNKHKEKVMIIAAGDLAEQGLQDLGKVVLSRGWASAPHGLLHLRSGANALGLDQVGCRPDRVGEDDSKTYASRWGEFCNLEGASYAVLATRGSGTTLAVGCDPIGAGGKKPGFLIACATLPNATTEKADVVLPLSTWVESHGVYVSTDGTVQISRQAILPVGESQPAWAIASALIKAVRGGEAPYKTTRQVFDEIGQLCPTFLGFSYRSFEQPGQVHWSYPQQADMGMPRPDLSAIPVKAPDTPMWMPVANTGSRVEKAARLTRGDRPPSVPGQDDPRRIAAMLGLAEDYVLHPATLAESPAPPREGYIPLRVMAAAGAQPAGPTPAQRHQKLGVGPHVPVPLPLPAVAVLPEAVAEAPAAAEVIKPATTTAPPPPQETAQEKSDEGKGQSNVANVDKVTEDSKSQAEAEPKNEGEPPRDGAHASDTGQVVEPESSSDSAAESQASEGETAEAAESEAPPATADSVDEESSPDPAPAESPGPEAEARGKAKKGKRKSSKEKK